MNKLFIIMILTSFTQNDGFSVEQPEAKTIYKMNKLADEEATQEGKK